MTSPAERPMGEHDEHFYGQDRAMADEMECPICGWPTRSDGCGHEAECSE